MERVTLPEGLEVHCLNVEEAKFLHDEIYRDGAYLQHGITLHDGAVVVDVGANIGMFAIGVSQRWKGVRVHCFEPIPAVFAVLQANAALHQLNATLHPVALGEADGEVEFTFYPRNTVMSGRHADAVTDRATTQTFLVNRSPAFANWTQDSRFQRHAEALVDRLFEGELVRCPVRRLSDVLAAEGVGAIDLLKIDVEKSEHEVLAGVDERDWARIRQVAVEVHDTDGRLAALVSAFEGRGYRVVTDQDPLLAGTAIHTLYALRS